MKKQNNDFSLVFVGKDEVYTTSEIIAEHAEVQHHMVTRLLRENKSDFEEFGVFGFEIHKPKSGSSGGRLEDATF